MPPTPRRVCYSVAMSLDGCIAGPNGEHDWIVMDPDIDFRAIFARFDTFLMGRKTYEAMAAQGRGGGAGGRTLVFSRTLDPAAHPGITVVNGREAEVIAELRKEKGKDIWLFGGGQLFASLAALGLVDRVEVAVIPVLLGGGVPFLPPSPRRIPLRLEAQRLYPKSGTMMLEYTVTP